MNKKLIGIIVVFVIVTMTPWGGLAHLSAIAVWIYLVLMVRKKKVGLFRDQMDAKFAERRFTILKAFLLVAEISLAVFVVNLVLQLAILGPLEDEGAVVFYIALVSLVLFLMATIGGFWLYFSEPAKK